MYLARVQPNDDIILSDSLDPFLECWSSIDFIFDMNTNQRIYFNDKKEFQYYRVYQEPYITLKDGQYIFNFRIMWSEAFAKYARDQKQEDHYTSFDELKKRYESLKDSFMKDKVV